MHSAIEGQESEMDELESDLEAPEGVRTIDAPYLGICICLN
jgi:hypothetical protein